LAEHHAIEAIVIREFGENGKAQSVAIELDHGFQVVSGPCDPEMGRANFHVLRSLGEFRSIDF